MPKYPGPWIAALWTVAILAAGLAFGGILVTLANLLR